MLHAGLYWMVVVYYFPLFSRGPVGSNGSPLELLLMGFTHFIPLLEGVVSGGIATLAAAKIIYPLLGKNSILLASLLTGILLFLYLLYKLLVILSSDAGIWPFYLPRLKGELFLLGIISLPLTWILILHFKKVVNQKIGKSTA